MNTDPGGKRNLLGDTPNLRELTIQTLRNAILNMHLKPGERLVERKLCEQMGVSRTCVREALQFLESEGLANRVPSKGFYVATITQDEARQIYEVRAALESAAGRKFVERASEQEVKNLEKAFTLLEKTSRQDEIVPYIKSLEDFYDVLLAGAGNELAREVLQTLRARMYYLRALTSRASTKTHKAQTVQKMREIVDAVLRRDAAASEKYCRQFVERSAEFALEILRKQERKKQ